MSISQMFEASSDVARSISRTFARMEIAEELVAAAKKTARGRPRRNAIDVVFEYACPTEAIRDKSDDVYRSHVRELIDRAIVDEDMRPPTKAEILCGLLALSLKAPPSSEIRNLVDVLWADVMPQHPIDEPPNTRPVHTAWSSETTELYAEIRRRFPDAMRVNIHKKRNAKNV